MSTGYDQFFKNIQKAKKEQSDPVTQRSENGRTASKKPLPPLRRKSAGRTSDWPSEPGSGLDSRRSPVRIKEAASDRSNGQQTTGRSAGKNASSNDSKKEKGQISFGVFCTAALSRRGLFLVRFQVGPY